MVVVCEVGNKWMHKRCQYWWVGNRLELQYWKMMGRQRPDGECDISNALRILSRDCSPSLSLCLLGKEELQQITSNISGSTLVLAVHLGNWNWSKRPYLGPSILKRKHIPRTWWGLYSLMLILSYLHSQSINRMTIRCFTHRLSQEYYIPLHLLQKLTLTFILSIQASIFSCSTAFLAWDILAVLLLDIFPVTLQTLKIKCPEVCGCNILSWQ